MIGREKPAAENLEDRTLKNYPFLKEHPLFLKSSLDLEDCYESDPSAVESPSMSIVTALSKVILHTQRKDTPYSLFFMKAKDNTMLAKINFLGPKALCQAHEVALSLRVAQLDFIKQNPKLTLVGAGFVPFFATEEKQGFTVLFPQVDKNPLSVLEKAAEYANHAFAYSGGQAPVYMRIQERLKSLINSPSLEDTEESKHIQSSILKLRPHTRSKKIDRVLENFLKAHQIRYIRYDQLNETERMLVHSSLAERIEEKGLAAFDEIFIIENEENLFPEILPYCSYLVDYFKGEVSLFRKDDKFFAKIPLKPDEYRLLKEKKMEEVQLGNQEPFHALIPMRLGEFQESLKTYEAIKNYLSTQPKITEPEPKPESKPEAEADPELRLTIDSLVRFKLAIWNSPLPSAQEPQQEPEPTSSLVKKNISPGD